MTRHAISPALSVTINAARWIAALFVVLEHCRSIILVDYGDVTNQNLLTAAIYLITSLGRQSVIIFFVASGLLVGGISLEEKIDGEFSVVKYMIARISRIYTVLIPAIVVGYALDLLGSVVFLDAGFYDNSMAVAPAALSFSVIERLGWQEVLGTLAMVQPFLVHSLGSNGPLWSLSYEWWYYVIFGAALAVVSNNIALNTVLAAFSAVAIVAIVPPELSMWMIFWIFGVALYFYGKSKLPRPPVWFGAFACLIGLGASVVIGRNGAAHHDLMRDFFEDGIVAIGFGILIISMSRGMSEESYVGIPAIIMKINKRMAEFSYSTYLFHMPLIVFVASMGKVVLKIDDRLQPGMWSFVIILAIVTLTYLYSLSMYGLAEAHTRFVKARLSNVVDRIVRKRSARSP